VRFLSTRVHGMLDYLVGALLIALPFAMNFGAGWQTWLPVALGGGAIVYGLMTRYELGVMPVIPMPVHLMIDFGSGLLLAASPWLFGFASIVWLPHVIFGLFEMGAAAVTRPVPGLATRSGLAMGDQGPSGLA
jgi:hypothetical protein